MHRKTPNRDLVAVYARVSGDRQEKEESIDTQLFKLEERVQRDGLPIHERYLDNPYTGTVINRPALDRLMDDARQGHFNRVLIYDPDRLSRGKPWMRGYLEEQLARAGVSVVYLNYEVEDSKEGRAKDGMITVFNEWERETLVQRMKDGRERRIRQGHIWRGPRPFGWRYMPASEGEKYGHMELHPEEAPVVRDVFSWILAGRTTHWVAGELNRRGVLTPHGHGWTSTNVSRTIHNHLHSGQPPINRYQSCEPDKPKKQYRRAHTRSSHKERPRAEWKRVSMPIAIVTPEEQFAAEAQLTANKQRSTRNAKHEYLLSGLCRCGWERIDRLGAACDHTMTGSPINKSHNHLQYRCNRNYPSLDRTMTCCKGRIRLDVVEPIVWAQVVALLRQPDTLIAQMDEANAGGADNRARLEQEMTSATVALDAAQAKLKALLSKNLAGLVDDVTYQAVQRELVGERENAQQRLAYATQSMGASEQRAARWQDVRAYCDAVSDKLDELELPEHFARRKDLVRALITAVRVYPDRIAIEGVLPAVSAGNIDTLSPRIWCSRRRPSIKDP